jgi:uncharacterized protein (TIRG00374 family)
MLEPLGYKIKTLRAFWAIMGGYLVNVAVPRMGEITRCVVIKKTDEVPMAVSVGSVILERVIDLLILICIIIFALIFQFGRISSFFSETFLKNKSVSPDTIINWLIILLVMAVAGFILTWFQWENIKKTLIFNRMKPVIRELINGLLSIRKVKSKSLFFASTFIIWFLYYMMLYVMALSFKATINLNPLAILVVLMAGGLGMSAPVQGGIGTYHAFVSSVLILYGIDRQDGVLFATLSHTSQFVFVLIMGSISLLISAIIGKKQLKNDPDTGQNINTGAPEEPNQ